MSQMQTCLPATDSGTAISTVRFCRVCHEEKPISEFRIGLSGRMKKICDDCTDALITAAYGAGLRRCATCGRLTSNYRCSACWKAMRGEMDLNGLDPNYLP